MSRVSGISNKPQNHRRRKGHFNKRMSEAAKIIVTVAAVECRMCPTIVTGRTANGCTVYARYRWGQLSVRLDPRDPAPDGGAAGVWILQTQIDPEGLDGYMRYEELIEHTSEIIEWPVELSPRTFDDGADELNILTL
jgi:hypothetical protein